MSSPISGVGRYTTELARHLAQLEVDIQYFAERKWHSIPPCASKISNLRRHIPSAFLGTARALDRVRKQLAFNSGVRKHPVDLYHEPNYLAYRFSGPIVVTAHDASWVRYPDTHPEDRVNAMNRYFPDALERADRVIVVSNFVSSEMQSIFSVPPAKLRPIHLGVSPCFRPLASGQTYPVMQRYQLIHGCYILAVGTLEPRKNLSNLLHAYERLSPSLSRAYPLIIVGMPGWKHHQTDSLIARLQHQGQVRVLGHVPDQDLPALYAGATVFAYPSLYEGFGLPPLEAMASGVPVIASNVSAISEVVAEAGMLCEPRDPIAISALLETMLEDERLRVHMSQLGLSRAAQFSWHNTALQTLDVYREVAR